MQRSGGVTASAVLVFIGSGLTLIAAAFSSLALLALRNAPEQPAFVRYSVIGVGVFEAAFAIWGILSGIGLLRLREWARISLLVFSGLALFCTAPALVIVPLMPIPQSSDLPANFPIAMKLILEIVYAIPAAIGGWWLYYFNTRSVRDQFRGEAANATGAETGGAPARPLSITIIGWIMLIGGGISLPLSFLRFPVLFGGFVLAGWSSFLYLFGWCAFQVVAGAGLLKLKRWAWMLAVCGLSFGLANALISVLIPGWQARFDEAMSLVRNRMGMPDAQPPLPIHFFFWFGLAFGLLYVGVQLWFVAIHKKDFFPASESPARSSEV